MKSLLIMLVAQIFMLPSQAQQFALGNDKFNIAYIGLDNPISIAVENCPCSRIILKVDNGTVTGKNCRYIFRGKEVGAANIRLYKRTANHLKQVGQYAFRVKQIPAPVFKIGPYGVGFFYADRKAQRVVLKSQEYVRAELDGFDFDARCMVDSFQVKIFLVDSAKTITYCNASNKISQPIKDAFAELKNGDVVFFNRIFAKGPDGIQWQLDPLILTIE